MGVVVATAVIIIAVTVMLVTGYMSAFKPGKNETAASTGYSGGARSGGVGATVTSPSPTPMPTPFGPGEMPMPENQAASRSGPSEQPALQIPPGSYATEPQQAGISYPSPTVAAVVTRPPEFTGESPSGTIGGKGGSWFNPAPTSIATSAPTQPPMGVVPGQRQPVASPEKPVIPTIGQNPYEFGWRQIIQRLLEAIPLMFPGYYPGLQWYSMP